jgi:Tfp pilus assembly protein PilZ
MTHPLVKEALMVITIRIRRSPRKLRVKYGSYELSWWCEDMDAETRKALSARIQNSAWLKRTRFDPLSSGRPELPHGSGFLSMRAKFTEEREIGEIESQVGSLLRRAGVKHKQSLPLRCTNCARAIGGFGLPLICVYCGARIMTRYACAGTAEMNYNETSCSGRVCDIGTGGCFIKTPYTYPIGAEVRLLLRIAGTQLDLDARVVRIIPQTGVGVAFEGLSTEQEKLLTWIIGDAKSTGPAVSMKLAGTAQSATAPAPVSRNAELLAQITKRVNEQGVLTRQDLTDLVHGS